MAGCAKTLLNASRIVFLSLSLLLFQNLLAATDTDDFTVTATVNNVCNITASDLSFGTHDPTAGVNTDQTTTIAVTCTFNASYNVGLDAGDGDGATVAVRKMTSEDDDTLNYSLYQNEARTTVWGATIGTNTVAGTGTGAEQTLTVYGRIPSGQTSVPAGSYSDTITATITF